MRQIRIRFLQYNNRFQNQKQLMLNHLRKMQQMTMRDMWVNHHQVIWKIQRERLLVDQVVLEALAVTLARPLVIRTQIVHQQMALMLHSHPERSIYRPDVNVRLERP